jgi:hypothetical protein
LGQLGLHLLQNFVCCAEFRLNSTHSWSIIEPIVILFVVRRIVAGRGWRFGTVPFLQSFSSSALLLHKRGQLVRFLSGCASYDIRGNLFHVVVVQNSVNVSQAVLGGL